jgi:chromosome segregation ATPase
MLQEEAEFDAAHMRHLRRECEKRIIQYEARMVQVQEDMQKEIDKQVELLRRSMKECDDLRDETKDVQRGAITMFDEQKRYKSHIQRLQSDVHRANTAMDKMRDEAVRLRSKNDDLRDERSRMKQQQEDDDAGQTVLVDRDSTIENLQSLLEIRNQELDVLERSVATTHEERTRLQLHSNEMTMSMVSLRQELEEARTVSIAARASEEAGRQ